MEKSMKLRAYIKLEDDGTMVARCKLYDETEFKVKVTKYDVHLNEEFTDEINEVTGFVGVTVLSTQDRRSYIQLPKPSLEHGHNVTVNKYMLQPYGASIEQFLGPGTSNAPSDSDYFLDITPPDQKKPEPKESSE